MLTLTSAQAGASAYEARRLLKAKTITPYQFALMDCLLWTARKPGQARLVICYRRLKALINQGRSTVIAGIGALERHGLIRRIKRRVRVAWALGVASRQAANGYEIVPPDTGSSRQPATRLRTQDTYASAPNAAVAAAQEALKRVRERSRGEASLPSAIRGVLARRCGLL